MGDGFGDGVNVFGDSRRRHSWCRRRCNRREWRVSVALVDKRCFSAFQRMIVMMFVFGMI